MQFAASFHRHIHNQLCCRRCEQLVKISLLDFGNLPGPCYARNSSSAFCQSLWPDFCLVGIFLNVLYFLFPFLAGLGKHLRIGQECCAVHTLDPRLGAWQGLTCTVVIPCFFSFNILTNSRRWQRLVPQKVLDEKVPLSCHQWKAEWSSHPWLAGHSLLYISSLSVIPSSTQKWIQFSGVCLQFPPFVKPEVFWCWSKASPLWGHPYTEEGPHQLRLPPCKDTQIPSPSGLQRVALGTFSLRCVRSLPLCLLEPPLWLIEACRGNQHPA